MEFEQYAFLKFGGFVRRREKYLGMRTKLRKAHIFIPYEEYVSKAIATSIIVGIVSLILGIIFGFIIASMVTLPTLTFTNSDIAWLFRLFTPYKNTLIIVFVGLIVPLVFAGICYFAFMLRPSLTANLRKVRIDTQLPNAVTYMYALSKGETNIVEIIRAVAELPNVYGEISHEFAMVLRDTDLLGIDFMTALRNIQYQTPSSNFDQLVGNLITLIDNGGDIEDFLGIQIERYRTDTKSEHSLFLDMLGMLAEAYVTGFVAAPLFILIVAVTIGAMKGSMTVLLMVMTYVIIPFSSIAFIFLIDLMLPKDEQTIGKLDLKKIKQFVGLRVMNVKKENEAELLKEYVKSRKIVHLKSIAKDPLHAFFEEPTNTLIVSVPAAFIALAIPIISNPDPLFKGYVEAFTYLTDYLLLAVIIAFAPFIIFYEIRARKIRKIENAIPSFLKHLSIINETGLSLSESLRILLRTERGPLRPHIERMYTDISWGASTKEAFIRFANKIKINILSRLVALITKASESSGDIREVLEIAAADMNINLQLKKDKFINMLIYVIVLYITFMVFLYVVYTLAATFLPQMAKAGQAGGSAGGSFIRAFDPRFYDVYFYHTALIQGFFSGMMAGVLGEGDARLGFKHSIVMMLVAFAVFKLAVL